MRIAFVLAGLGPGGAERVVSLLATELTKRGHAVWIIAFDAPDAPIYHALDSRVHLVRLAVPPMPGIRGGVAMVRRLWALRRTLRELNPELTIAFLSKINVLTLIASAGLRTGVIVSERNNFARQNAHPLWRALLWLCYRRADRIIMQTEASVGALPAALQQCAIVIPNPVMVPQGHRAVTARNTLVAVGRLTHQKGFDLLIDAFARLAPAHPDWRLMIWGEGPDERILRGRVAALGMEDRIFLPGLSRATASWLDDATAFVLSSRYEGFPNVLGEAMASGLPVVAFNCAFGPAEMISHGENGLLIDDGNVAALADALDTLMDNGALRARLGAAARAGAGRFALDRIIAQWEALLPPPAAAE